MIAFASLSSRSVHLRAPVAPRVGTNAIIELALESMAKV